jgi:hypothetical protein
MEVVGCFATYGINESCSAGSDGRDRAIMKNVIVGDGQKVNLGLGRKI